MVLAAALFGLLILCVAAYAWWPTRPASFRGPGAPQDQPGTVLLVPGYGGGTGALEALARRLRSAGREARVVQAVGDGRGDLREQAAALDRAVRSALEDAPSVDLIGYSAGGVTVRLWVDEYAGDRVARRIVTLGSPHHGTDVATGASAFLPDQCPEACRQLVPGSELLEELNAGDETPDGPRWVSIWTGDDRVVIPPDTAELAGAVNVEVQDVCPGEVSHGELPTDPTTVGVILRALGPGLTAAPGASDCSRIRASARSAADGGG